MQLWLEAPRERDHLKDIGVDGSLILKWFYKKRDGKIDCIDLDHWQVLVYAVTNFRVTLNAGNFLSSLETVSFSARTPLNGFS
jgi:hypothetical protein